MAENLGTLGADADLATAAGEMPHRYDSGGLTRTAATRRSGLVASLRITRCRVPFPGDFG